jgi:hypothetical protein
MVAALAVAARGDHAPCALVTAGWLGTAKGLAQGALVAMGCNTAQMNSNLYFFYLDYFKTQFKFSLNFRNS